MLGSMAGKDLGLKNPTDLYVGLLKSQTVSDSIVQRFDLRKVYHKKKFEDARKRLEKASDILSTKESMISVSVTDKDPRRAADLANAYVDELQKLNSSLAVTEASRAGFSSNDSLSPPKMIWQTRKRNSSKRKREPDSCNSIVKPKP